MVTSTPKIGIYKLNTARSFSKHKGKDEISGLSHSLLPIEIETDSIEILQYFEDTQPTYSFIIMSCRLILKKLENSIVHHNFCQTLVQIRFQANNDQ
ncbi:hypothetical protein H5410_020975 [Solanum commersonii]|uniref:Uncharacterized protein n=1 Tax=Solanum commersonii TaxID=4109 RepID=A0A9J5ZFT2_SOLCO|nr:hypothetical protein H5410_020975 [Solanum commersonii]